MSTATSPAPEDRNNKRLKQADDGPPASGSQSAPPPPPIDQSQRYPPPPPPQAQHYGAAGAAPNGPPLSHGAPGGYYGAPPPPPPHYGIHGSPPPPPHHWPGGGQPPGHGPPPPGRYPSGPPSRGLSPDRMNGGPSWSHHGGYRDPSTPKGQKSKSKLDRGDEYHYSQRLPPHGYQGPPPGYGPPPPPPPPGYGPPPMYASQGTWTGKSPPRSAGRHHDPYRHEMDLPPYMGHGQESVDDDGASSTAESNREKGRGSYKCGRCGVPKKGHVCPYQPKLKRRPDEPQPQTRSAAVQVEMDEFMTLRRLNIRIQGFPESYATEPYMTAESTLMVSEPVLQHHPGTSTAGLPPDMSAKPINYGPHPEQRLSSNGVCMPTLEQTEVRDTGVGDDPVYEEDGKASE